MTSVRCGVCFRNHDQIGVFNLECSVKSAFRITCLAGLLLAHPAFADGETEAQYRQSVMKSVGGHMASMGNILKNRIHMEDDAGK